MNKFIGVGTLSRAGIVNGSENKVLRFTLTTLVGYNKKTKKNLWSFVPCVVFKPSESIVDLLTRKAEGVMIGLEGRVNTSKFETKDHTIKYATEVIVEERNIQILQVTVGPATSKEKGA